MLPVICTANWCYLSVTIYSLFYALLLCTYSNGIESQAAVLLHVEISASVCCVRVFLQRSLNYSQVVIHSLPCAKSGLAMRD